MRRLFMFALAASFVGIAATLKAKQNTTPSLFDPETVMAWQREGAEVGWVGWTKSYSRFYQGAKRNERDVPAFLVTDWKEGVISKLPRPQCAFGLHLVLTEVTDARLKELAGLKALQVL